jgi:hypothetical protein
MSAKALPSSLRPTWRKMPHDWNARVMLIESNVRESLVAAMVPIKTAEST